MIVACSHCTARLQLDDTKVPARLFTLRCPKCQGMINVQPPATMSDQSALSIGESPSTEQPRFEQPKPAPAFNLETGASEKEPQAAAGPSSGETNELAHLLLELLQRGGSTAVKPQSGMRLPWDRRKALVCVSPAHREAVARVLAANNYKVFVAADSTQALERMREEQMDILMLDPEFDPVEQGGAFVTREVFALRAAVRRRLFFIHFSPAVRTLDAHAAFVQNVNLVVNPVDVENLPQVLERAIRDYNDLYRDFNAVLNVAAL